MHIISHKRTFEPCNFIWNGKSFFFELFLTFFQIVFCNFFSEMSASGMDYDKKISFFVFVCFNKMISRAKTAETQDCFIGADVFAAFQCMEVKFICKAVCFCADCKSGGDRFSYYGIKLLAFDFFALNPGSGFSLYFIKNR